jgi:hypothetical protein
VPEPRKRRLLPLLPTECDLRAFDWSLEKKAYGLLWLLLTFCPFWWAIDRREPDGSEAIPGQETDWNRRRANWVLGWLVLLVAIWLANPGGEPGRLIVGVLAGLRLLEIFVTGLGTILNQPQQIRARNVVTILIYAVQVTLIFAILYHSFAATGFEHDGEVPTRPSDFLYISWSSAAALGSDFTAETSAARFLEVATTTASIFLLTVLFGYAIDAVGSEEKDRAGPGDGAISQCHPPPLSPNPCLDDPGPPVGLCEADPSIAALEPLPRLSLALSYLKDASRLRKRLRRRRFRE